MDYALLISRYTTEHERQKLSMQRSLQFALRRAIQQGSLVAGSRLLSSRILAQELGIARNTVVYAYEQLVAEGFLETNRRGTIVTKIEAMPQAVAPDIASHRALAKRAQSILSLPVPPELSSGFAPGVPALKEFPIRLWRSLLDKTWRASTAQHLAYAEAAGEPSLRAAIVEHLRASRGVECDFDQVIITDGTQSSLDLCAHAFADAGDKVWMENPGYMGAQIAFKSAQLKIIGINIDEDGLAPKTKDWLQHPPKLIYVTPSHQYPSGSILSLERRIALIGAATQHQSLIIEDDYDSEFRHDGPPLPAMQGLVKDAPVIYLGTFSKTMFPALRIAYMVVPKNVIAALRTMVATLSLRGRRTEQLCLAQFIHQGHFVRHVRRMRKLYRQRRDALVAALSTLIAQQAIKVEIIGDQAGMHLALRFKDHSVDDIALSNALLKLGIIAPALSLHRIGSRLNTWRGLMLGYAQVPSEDIPGLVKKMSLILATAISSA